MSDAFAALVRRYQDAASPTLSVSWSLSRLLDRDLCAQLMTDLRSHGSPWEVQLATEHAWEMIPEEPGLYAFVWRPNFSLEVAEHQYPGGLAQVLYIGKAGADDRGRPTTGNLRLRYKQYVKHIAGDPACLWTAPEPKTRPQRLDHYLKLRPLEIWFTIVSQRSEIPHLEDRLIKVLNPPCNIQRLPDLKPGQRQRAF